MRLCRTFRSRKVFLTLFTGYMSGSGGHRQTFAVTCVTGESNRLFHHARNLRLLGLHPHLRALLRKHPVSFLIQLTLTLLLDLPLLQSISAARLFACRAIEREDLKLVVSTGSGQCG